jgi:hypothetical protein
MLVARFYAEEVDVFSPEATCVGRSGKCEHERMTIARCIRCTDREARAGCLPSCIES